MQELLEKLFEILPIIIYGSVFYIVFQFVRLEKVPLSEEHELIKVAIIGYILRTLYDLGHTVCPIPEFIFIIFIVIIGYAFAKLFDCSLFNTLLRKIHIYQSAKSSIWSKIIGDSDNEPIIATLVNTEKKIKVRGVIDSIDDNEILIREYVFTQNYGESGAVVSDKCKFTDREKILLDTSEFDYVRISYYGGKYSLEEEVAFRIGNNYKKGKIIGYRNKKYKISYVNDHHVNATTLVNENDICKYSLGDNVYILKNGNAKEVKIVGHIHCKDSKKRKYTIQYITGTTPPDNIFEESNIYISKQIALEHIQ